MPDGYRSPEAKRLRARKNYLRKMASPTGYKKLLARNLARSAIRSGRLVRLPCEVCGSGEVEAHHDDYSQPLAVRWLCPEHHRQHHAQQPSSHTALDWRG